MEQQAVGETAGATRLAWRRRLAVIAMVVVVASVGARVALAPKEKLPAARGTSTSGLETALLTNETRPPPEAKPRSGARKILPFITEAGIALLLGLAVGIATRMIAKVVIAVLLLFFLSVQFMAYKGLIQVDWGGFGANLGNFVLNISDDADLQSILKHKVPTLASFVIGYILGLKR